MNRSCAIWIASAAVVALALAIAGGLMLLTCTQAGQGKSGSPAFTERKIKSGQKALAGGRLSEAVSEAREARSGREDALAYLLEGTALRLRADFDAAEKALSRALELDARSRKARLERGLLYARRYEADAGFLTPFMQQHGPIDIGPTKDQMDDADRWKRLAIEDLRGLPEDATPGKERPLVAGVLAFLDGSFNAALKSFEDSSGHLETALWRGRMLQLANRHDEAVVEIDRYLQTYAEDPHAWVIRAVSRLAQGDLPQAEENCTKAARLDPRCAHAWYVIGLGHHSHAYGLTQEKSPDFRPALDAYTKAIEADPNFPLTYLARSLLLMHDQQSERALADLTTFIRLKPRAPIGYNRRASIHVQRSDFQSAIDDYTSAIGLDLSYYYGYTNRARVYMLAERWAEAAADYTRAIEIRPDEADCYANRGVCHAKASKPYEAMKDFERAITLDPTLEPQLKEQMDAARRKARQQ